MFLLLCIFALVHCCAANNGLARLTKPELLELVSALGMSEDLLYRRFSMIDRLDCKKTEHSSAVCQTKAKLEHAKWWEEIKSMHQEKEKEHKKLPTTHHVVGKVPTTHHVVGKMPPTHHLVGKMPHPLKARNHPVKSHH